MVTEISRGPRKSDLSATSEVLDRRDSAFGRQAADFAMPLSNPLSPQRPTGSATGNTSSPSTEPISRRCAASCRSCPAACRRRFGYEVLDEANAYST